MNTVLELIDFSKAKIGVDSDNQLAARLKLTRGAVSRWRTGNGYPDAIACEKIAGITGVPLARVLGIVGEARAISREEKAVWRRLASAAAIACLMVVSVPSPASVRVELTQDSYMHYAK